MDGCRRQQVGETGQLQAQLILLSQSGGCVDAPAAIHKLISALGRKLIDSSTLSAMARRHPHAMVRGE